MPGAGVPWQLRLNFRKLDLAAGPAPGFSNLNFVAAGKGGTVLQANGTTDGVVLTVAPSGQRRGL